MRGRRSICPKRRGCGSSDTNGRRGRTRSRTSSRATSSPIAGSTSTRDPDTRALLDAAGVDASDLPALFFEDGSALRNPEPRQVAERLGRSLSAALQPVRPRDRRRRPAGLGGGGVRRVGGSAHAAARSARAGRTGRQQLANRELSRVSGRRQRQRADAARRDSGAAARRGVPGAARSHVACRSTPDTSS